MNRRSMNCPLSVALFCAMTAYFTIPNSAPAIDVATGPLGSDIQAVRDMATRNANETRDLGWNLNGAGINLGQIEGGRPGDPSLTDGNILFGNSELFHPAINPGGPLVIGVAIAGTTAVAGTDNNMFLDPHATSVAGMMVAQNAGGSAFGSAPGAILFSSTLSSSVAPVRGTLGQRVVTDGEWLNGRSVRFFNNSYGLGVAASLDAAGNNGVLDGNHLQTLYFDWASTHHNMIPVVAGDESIFQRDSIWAQPAPETRNELGIDLYDGLVVGATGQRAGAAGRYDQVANFSNSNRTVDARGWRTDIVAPGGTSFSVQLRQRDDTGTAATNPNFGRFIGANRTVDIFPANNLPNEDFSPNPGAAFTNLGAGDPNMPTLLDNNGDNAFNQAGPAPMDSAGMARSGGTSFAAPQVTAMLGIMQQYAASRNSNLDHLTLKAALLNSASKHVLSKRTSSTGGDLSDTAGQSWAQRYAANNPNPLNMAAVRDSDSGFGQLNGLSAIKQVSNLGSGSSVSLELSNVAAFSDSVKNLFVGGETLKPGSLVTATITWDRIVNTTMANPTLAQLQDPANYTVQQNNNGGINGQPIADLDLSLVNVTTGTTVAASRMVNDNVEHIYFNVPTEGRYNLVVHNFSNQTTTYGMAFSAGTSDGISFTVDSSTRGIQTPASPSGGGNYPNDVNALGHSGQGDFDTGGEIFASSTNGTNMQRLSGALGTRSRVGPHLAVPSAQNLLDNSLGVLGLQSGDQMTAMAYGDNGTRTTTGANTVKDSIMLFSVSTLSQGANNTSVKLEKTAMRQAGDIFKSSPLTPFGYYASPRLLPAVQGNNDVLYTGAQLGLKAGDPQQDNLRDFKLENIRTRVDPDGDGVHNAPVFFSLASNSPSITKSAGLLAANEIFVSKPQDNDPAFNPNTQAAAFSAFNVYADAAAIGLQAGDKINALVLSDTGANNVPDGDLQPFVDFNTPFDSALFTLTSDSPSLGAIFQGSAADIFYTAFDGRFSVFTYYNELGLAAGDSIDGLDIASVPEPATFALLAIGMVGAALLRRRLRNLA